MPSKPQTVSSLCLMLATHTKSPGARALPERQTALSISSMRDRDRRASTEGKHNAGDAIESTGSRHPLEADATQSRRCKFEFENLRLYASEGGALACSGRSCSCAGACPSALRSGRLSTAADVACRPRAVKDGGTKRACDGDALSCSGHRPATRRQRRHKVRVRG